SSPPFLAMVWENRSPGTFLVPRNIICSKKWARPEMPCGSSTPPTLNHSIWVTTGARWSGSTSTCMPLARAKEKACAPLAACSGAAAAPPARQNTVETARAMRASRPLREKKRSSEPVKPAAARCLGGGGRLPGRTLAALHFRVGIDGLTGIGLRRGAQQAGGEARIGALHPRLIGLQLLADARIDAV